MASRTYQHQLFPLRLLPNAALLNYGLTSCTCDASTPDDTNTSAAISTDTFTNLNGWTRELKVGSLALFIKASCMQAS
jgi:hypothetical protein